MRGQARGSTGLVSFTLSSVIFAAAQMSAAPARATTVLPLSAEQLAERSPIVIYGRVVQIEVAANGARTAIVETIDTVRAPAPYDSQRDFLVPLLDRRIPGRDIIERVSGAPELKLREELVVFLRPIQDAQAGLWQRRDGQPLFALEGLGQGRFRVLESRQGARVVQGSTDPDHSESSLSDQELLNFKPSVRLKPSKANPRPQATNESLATLDSLLTKVRAENGRFGQ